MEEKIFCLYCEKEIKGRIDKKFCDSYCRNTYNNRTKNTDEKNIALINKIIRKNRRILKILCPIGKAIVRKEVMDAMGFNYDHFSGFFNTKKGLYYINYDYGFSPMVEKGVEKAIIIQKQDYMSNYSPWKYIKQ